ncbi:hypothetical protein EXIGLDRAFT_770865 [Exidia glandulosa HHB12029]|uniref:Uncharacterized protein n=1 Tax=Exidia glandulosa HHB12029 TaxID=1314781 RepID=A0A165GDN5_EXIGL|nr:hypothetical protein EXIGLDRAFT_770865 [Exidia glandulosa HHB12029]
MLVLLHTALRICGTTMPRPDIWPVQPLPKYSNSQRTPHVRTQCWHPACVPQSVTFLPPNGTPVCKAIPMNTLYQYKVNRETWCQGDAD